MPISVEFRASWGAALRCAPSWPVPVVPSTTAPASCSVATGPFAASGSDITTPSAPASGQRPV